METIYTSKKHPDVTAKIVKKPNETTVILEYLTGDKVGENTTITTGTLERYWRKGEKKSATDVLNVDMNEVNEPYPEPEKKEYIPKPEVVKEYEAKKRVSKVVPRDYAVPTDYEEFADKLAERGVTIKRVNKGYIALPDSTKLKLLGKSIGILASDYVAENFAKAGFMSKPCIEKGTPFRFDIITEVEYNKMYDILSGLTFDEGGEK